MYRLVYRKAVGTVLNDIIPCSLTRCICVEYLNFTSQKEISFYKKCIREKMKENGIYDKISYLDYYIKYK